MPTREIWKTRNDVFDEFTQRNLFKLMSEGYFEEPISPIKMGKEANVFTAKKDDGKVIVKIYRLQTCDFNKMFNYIRSDPRYINIKKNKRKVIFSWTQREYRNLLKAREAGVNVPTPYTCKFNIIVMEYIGYQDPAPQLKDVTLSNVNDFKQQIYENIRKLLKGGLIHGDLSAFNILVHNDKPVFIDFSQCVPVNTPNSEELIERDKKNIEFFFKKYRHHEIQSRT